MAEVAGVTEVTIRNRYKEIAKEFGFEERVDPSRSHAQEGELSQNRPHFAKMKE